jgi:hypothetical protein
MKPFSLRIRQERELLTKWLVIPTYHNNNQCPARHSLNKTLLLLLKTLNYYLGENEQ